MQSHTTKHNKIRYIIRKNKSHPLLVHNQILSNLESSYKILKML